MNAESIIELAGGRKAVMLLTGRTKQCISFWVVNNYIPVAWLALLKEKFPSIKQAKLQLSAIPPGRKSNNIDQKAKKKFEQR